MRILVTGGNGMLGVTAKKFFKQMAPSMDLIMTDVYDLDVRNYDSVMEYMKNMSGAPDAIWHMAAETNLEICELRPEQAYITNTVGTFNVMKLAQLFDVPLIYMSTAGVFNGRLAKPYIETDTPNPVNHYGRSKYYGELALNSYDKVYIFRMSWAMGGGPKFDKKFVNKIYQLAKSGASTIYGIDNVFGSPTYFKDVVMTIHNSLIAELPFGIYHIGGQGRASRFDVANAIVETLEFDVKVEPVPDSYFRSQFPCARSKNECLDTQKDFKDANKMRPWREALDDYLKEYYL